MQVSSMKSKINEITNSTDRGDVPYGRCQLSIKTSKSLKLLTRTKVRFSTEPH